MRYLTAFAAVLGIALISIVFMSSANAQASRTWVSGVGDDVNPCSRTAPCKTFAGAISKTAPAGEINVLDPGGFGTVTITKSITIRSDHVEAGVLAAGLSGIIISAGVTDVVVLEGLDIEGFGSGIHGISVVAGGKIYVNHCTIHHFTQNGINMASNTNGARIFVSDSFIANNAGGVNVQGSANIANITNTQILSNASFSVQANGASNIVALQNSVLNDSPTGISALNGGVVNSVGPSNLLTGAGAFNTTIPFK